MPTPDPSDRRDAPATAPTTPRTRAGWWWHLAVALLVAPFYIGLYLVTAIGALLPPRDRA